MHDSHYVALISRWVFNLVLNSFTVADFLTGRGSLFHNLGAAYINALSPRVIFFFLKGISTMFDLENFGGGSMFEMMISSLKVPECNRCFTMNCFVCY